MSIYNRQRTSRERYIFIPSNAKLNFLSLSKCMNMSPHQGTLTKIWRKYHRQPEPIKMSNKVYKFQDLWRHGWILLPYEAFSQICLPLFLKILKHTFSEVAGSLSDCFGDGRLARNIRISFAGNFIFPISKTFYCEVLCSYYNIY